jgi:hypothetical protein
MKKCSTPTLGMIILLCIVAFPSIVHAATYNASGIIAIAVGAGGEVYIRWTGLPNPGPCGGNNNYWVVIPAPANETLKALALSLYFSGKPARIDTSGCSGAYENVVTLYSPAGG